MKIQANKGTGGTGYTRLIRQLAKEGIQYEEISISDDCFFIVDNQQMSLGFFKKHILPGISQQKENIKTI